MNHSILTQIWKSPVGELIIGEFDGQICMIDWRYRKMRKAIDQRLSSYLKANFETGDSHLINQTILQLQEYFNEDRQRFDLPLLLAGTNFQQKVWNELMRIPFGKTRTYLELSKSLGDEKAIRAVASANGANAISIVVPCHRIIGHDGKLVGYAGGLKAKEQLLQVEKADVSSQISLF